MPERSWRPAWAEVDLDAIAHNARLLAERAAPAALCAVVKADGYGHGAVQAARAAVSGGATWLAVALVEEGVVLREAGLDQPILLLSEPPLPAMADALAARLTPTLYTRAGVHAADAAARKWAAHGGPWAVHVKLDTGMHRVGAHPMDASTIVGAVVDTPALALDGLWTHLAVADDPVQDAFTAGQLGAFRDAVADLAASGVRPRWLHAANSAGTLAHPSARFDLVRCGLALYGYAPGGRPGEAGAHLELRPALSLHAQVAFARPLAAGQAVSYGRRYRLPEDATVATVPLGYADGVPRRLSELGGHVLIGGARRPIAGTVTMDQLMVDCGPRAPVEVGDEVVLLGGQGDQTITADEWAERLGTIAYEVLCGISARVPRRYRGGGRWPAV